MKDLLKSIKNSARRNRFQQFLQRPQDELEGDEWSGLRANTEKGDLYLYDVIGWPWVTALDVMDLVGKIQGDTLNLHINSPGGDVFEGFAIFNALRNSGKNVVTHVDGLAASAASYIAMAGSKVQMAENAMMMIHDPWTFSIGNAADLRKDADILDKIKGGIVATYATRAQIDKAEAAQMMADETWMTAEEAVEKGFADSIGAAAPEEAKNRFDLSIFNRAPGNAPEGKGESNTIRSAEFYRRQNMLNKLKTTLKR